MTTIFPAIALPALSAMLGLCLMPALPLAAQEPAPAAVATVAPPPKPAARTVPVTLTTSAGAITIALEVERAPVTAGNFLRYVDQKRFDGTTFYRAFTYPGDATTGLIQGGTRNDPKRIVKPIALEPTSVTGLTHDDGAVSMARGAPGSADGDFFVILGKMAGLDANPAGAGDNQGYAVFGHVTDGMDVVRAIAASPKSPTAGVGAMKGQMLAPAVRILTARRAPVAAK
jgi:peptidyl-prolyl cis-trans isomerase A (cyclophilin A)